MDNSIECILGKMEARLDGLKDDIAEIRKEQKEIHGYITSQKIGFRVLSFLAVGIGTLFVYYKEHLEQLIFGTITKAH